MKKTIAIILALTLSMSFLFIGALTANAAGGYVKIGPLKYSSVADLKKVFAPNSTLLRDNMTLEVYGKVDIPSNPSYSPYYHIPMPDGTIADFSGCFFILTAKNVTVEGMTADATLYSSYIGDEGAAGFQSMIYSVGDNATFKNLTIKPYRNTSANASASGFVNKTLEVYSPNFTMLNCKITKLEGVNGTENGGTLYFNMAKENVLVQNCLFEKVALSFDSVSATGNVVITNNFFDGPKTVETALIGNVTWAADPVKSMGDVNISNNTFKNIPLDTIILRNSMQGKFKLADNVLDANGDGKPDNDSLAGYIKFYDSSFNYPGYNYYPNSVAELVAEATVLLTENGRIFKIVPAEDGTGNSKLGEEILSGLILSESNVTINGFGKTFDLDVEFVPPAKAVQPTWTSSNKNVATVDANGIVTTVGKGKTTITVSADNSEGKTISATCVVSVTDKAEPTPEQEHDLNILEMILQFFEKILDMIKQVFLNLGADAFAGI